MTLPSLIIINQNLQKINTSTTNTSETLIVTEDISDKRKIKNDINNTANNNQNLNNDVERVRKRRY